MTESALKRLTRYFHELKERQLKFLQMDLKKGGRLHRYGPILSILYILNMAVFYYLRALIPSRYISYLTLTFIILQIALGLALAVCVLPVLGKKKYPLVIIVITAAITFVISYLGRL